VAHHPANVEADILRPRAHRDAFVRCGELRGAVGDGGDAVSGKLFLERRCRLDDSIVRSLEGGAKELHGYVISMLMSDQDSIDAFHHRRIESLVLPGERPGIDENAQPAGLNKKTRVNQFGEPDIHGDDSTGRPHASSYKPE
jgi:hypothetical protein